MVVTTDDVHGALVDLLKRWNTLRAVPSRGKLTADDCIRELRSLVNDEDLFPTEY